MTDELRVETIAKRVRTYVGGQLVADSIQPRLVWEFPNYPTYYLPARDVTATLEPAGPGPSCELGIAERLDVVVDGHRVDGAALRYPDSPTLADLVRFDWNAMDEWLEEDEPVYTHARNPYHRVDILGSSRHVVVTVAGVTVADSRQPRILFETGLPARHYLPMGDVRMDLLRPSDTSTGCPYKGTAVYWDVVIDGTEHRDLAWGYRSPLPESQKIGGLVCFYNERVDLEVDGVPQRRPATEFS